MTTITKTKDQKAAEQQDALHALKNKQLAGDVKKISANINKDYEIKETNKNYVHVRVMTKHLNPGNKSIHEDVRIIPVHPEQFDLKVSQGAYATYDEVEIIHDPRENAPSPSSYKFKTDHVDVDAKPGKGDANVKQSKALERKIEEFKKYEEGLNNRFAELDQKAADVTKQSEELDRKLAEIKEAQEKLDLAKAELEQKQKETPAAPAGEGKK